MKNKKQVSGENAKQVVARHLFYRLANHHTILLMGLGCIKDYLRDCLKEGLSLEEIKARIIKILDSVERLERRAVKTVKTAGRISYHVARLLA